MKKHYRVSKLDGEYFIKYRYSWMPFWLKEIRYDTTRKISYYPYYDTLREALEAIEELQEIG